MRVIVILMTVALMSLELNAQAPEKSTETVTIHTSAVCEMCKTTIENALYKVKGVVTANLDVASGNVTVTYRTKKTNPESIKKAITMAGYDADEMKADKEAYDNLHGCCKKP